MKPTRLRPHERPHPPRREVRPPVDLVEAAARAERLPASPAAALTRRPPPCSMPALEVIDQVATSYMHAMAPLFGALAVFARAMEPMGEVLAAAAVEASDGTSPADVDAARASVREVGDGLESLARVAAEARPLALR